MPVILWNAIPNPAVCFRGWNDILEGILSGNPNSVTKRYIMLNNDDEHHSYELIMKIWLFCVIRWSTQWLTELVRKYSIESSHREIYLQVVLTFHYKLTFRIDRKIKLSESSFFLPIQNIFSAKRQCN